jgi:hypothetical protein
MNPDVDINNSTALLFYLIDFETPAPCDTLEICWNVCPKNFRDAGRSKCVHDRYQLIHEVRRCMNLTEDASMNNFVLPRCDCDCAIGDDHWLPFQELLPKF